MVATLDDYMNNGAKNSQKRSVPTLDDFMNNGVAQSNVVTPRVTSQPKSTPAVQTPVNKNVSIGEGIGNLGSAIGEGVGNFVQTVADNPLGFAKDTVNSLVVQPTKEFVANVAKPDATQSPFLAIGGGVTKGAIELPQNLWNLGVDAVNAYNNTPEQNQYKAHYVEDIANALQGNKLYQEAYQKPKRANEAIAELSSFAAPMAAAGKVGKVAGAIKNANNIAKESTRIASKLTDTQKIKYANQIQKLAQNNVLNGTVRTSANDIAGNMATGFGLGALEGDTLQDRIANGTGMAALGLALTGGHAAAQKAWNSKRALELRKNTAETLNNLTNEYDGVSKTVAGIDNALNTNLSNNASDLTRLRKEYGELSSKDQNYKRNISDEEKALLDDASKLSDGQQTEIFERNKLGSRERALRISKEVKAELANQQPQKHSTTVKNRKEAEKWFEDIDKREQEQIKANEEKEQADLEEYMRKIKESKEAWEKQKNSSSSTDDLSHVKSETDINTPDNIKTPKNEPSIRPQNEDMNYDFSNVKGENVKYGIKSNIEHPNAKMDESKVTRLEGGTAEGADSVNWYEKKTSPKPKQLGDENMYENYEVEGTKPTTDAELMQEIEAAKKQKDVPVVRSETKVDTRSASKRKLDRIHNEIKQKSWYKQLRNTKIKALNDDTKTKSMLDIVYEGQGTVRGSSPKMQSARKTEVSSNAKIKPYEGEAQASNKAEFRDPDTFKEVKINKSNEKSETYEDRINKIVAEKEFKHSNVYDYGSDFDIPLVSSLYKGAKNRFEIAKASSKSKTIKQLIETNDVFKILEQELKGLEDIKIASMPDSMARSTLMGKHIPSIKTIFINTRKVSNKVEFAKTLLHEIEHERQHNKYKQYIKVPAKYRTKNMIEYIKNYEYCKRTNEAKVNYYNKNKAVLDDLISNIENISNSERELYIDRLSHKKKQIYFEYKKLYNDYYNSQFEINARIAGDNAARKVANYDKQSLQMGRDRRSNIAGVEDRTNGTGFIQERNGKQSGLEQSISQSTKGYNEGLDSDKNIFGELNAHSNNDVRGVSENKLIHRTLNWFDKTKNNHTKFYHQFLEATPEIKKFTDAFKTINDKREAFFREFGTYTDERMKARLFKQSKSGEGVYFQQGTKRNPKVEWGKESNDKVGFTGKKELEGISERGTTQEGLARGFSDIVRMEHTRNRINFLKENFSKPQEGFIPVNSKLLANAMYFGKSKAWYETIRKGQEAIEKTFDEKNAKEWNELYKTTEADKSDIYIPKDLLDMSITGEKELPLDYLATYGKMRGAKGQIKGMAKIAGALLDFYTDRFKRKVLTSASFFTNNRFGNQIMLAMTADKPQDYIKGIADAFKLKESEVPTEILESTLAEAIQQEANAGIRKYFSEKNNVFDNIARILDGDEINSNHIAAKASNLIISKPNAIFRNLSKLTGEINERFERFERKQAYSQALTKMQREKVLKTAKQFAGIHELAEVAKKDTLIREAVIDKVADVLGDYNNFSKFEKNFMKKLIPFYAWNRTITRHIISLAKDNPVKATLVAFETYRLLNQDDGLEDYQHGSIKTGWHNNRTEGNVVINKASMIPYNTLFDMVSGENIGSFSPLITKPLEAARGEKFFKPASEITSKNWKRTTQDKKSGYVNTKTGEFREGKAPASVRAGYLAKDAIETVYPMTGSPMTKGLPDAVKHYNQTGEFLFPDKQYDANLGGFYDGDKAGKYKRGKKTYDRKLSAKNRLDLKYQLTNRFLGLGVQPEHKVTSKEQKEKYKNQRKRMRGN